MSADVKAMCDQLVAERMGYMLGTPEDRKKFAAYLDRLEVTHAGDPAMVAYVERSRRLLADREEP